MTLPSDRIQPINIGEIFAGAGQIMQLQHMQRQNQRQQEIDAALQAGDMKRWAQLDPVGAAKFQSTQLEAKKTGLEMMKTNQELVDKRQTANQNAQRFLLSALQADPNSLERVRQKRDELVANKVIDHFDLPGEDRSDPFLSVLPNEVKPNDITVAQRMVGVEDPYAKPSNEMVKFKEGEKNPAFRAYDLDSRPKGTTINVGGRNLPATQVNELSDLESALGSVDAIFDDFGKMVSSDGTGEQLIARLRAIIPNTSEAQYENSAAVAQQVVGKKMEGGKMAAGDEKKYYRFFPRPGDSPETARLKRDSLKAQLIRDSKARRAGLEGAGFNVSGGKNKSRRTADTDTLMDGLLQGGQ